MDPALESPSLNTNASQDENTRPPLSRSTSSLSGLVSRGAERVGEDWAEGPLVLLDVVETFFDSRLDLWERRLKEQSAKLRRRAGVLIPKGLRTPGGGILILDDEDEPASEGGGPSTNKRRAMKYRLDAEGEIRRAKTKLADKVNKLSASWASAQVVRTREKISFLFGVSTLSFTCLLYGMAPDWIPFAYTAQCAFYLPVRCFIYKQKSFHYFLFDMCYFVNVIDLIWLWFLPSSTTLFICCYLLTMGPLASAIITWRNSLVFHSLDKVTSLFIHIYPPIVFSIILFKYDNATERYPGIAYIDNYNWIQKIIMAAIPYCIWQASYFKFISIDRKDKIESGKRQNSFHYLLNDKHGPIGRALRGIPAAHREQWFIFGQFVYSLVFMVPASTLFIHNELATNIALVVIFLTSVWNGANFYVEVFGRKFERELERLRKEMENMSSQSSNGFTPSAPSTPYADPAVPVESALDKSPLVLPSTKDTPEMPTMTLGEAADEVTDDTGKPKAD